MHRAGPVLHVAEVALGPVAVQVNDVAAPSASVDAVEELLEESRSVPVVAAVPRRGRAEAHAGAHQLLPVAQNLVERGGLVVGAVARLVVSLHVGRVVALSQRCRRGPSLVDVVGHALGVGQTALARPEAVARRDVQRRHGLGPRVVGQGGLARVIPFEDAVARYAAVHDGRQLGHLQVAVGGNEAAAVAPALLQQRERDHVATLQAEGADAVVQLLVREGVHEAAAALQPEVAALLALEVLLAEDGERLCGVAVGQDDAATVVELHLAVGVVHGFLAAYQHVAGQQRLGCRGLHGAQNEHGVVGVLDVHHAVGGEGRGRRHDVVYVGCQRHRATHLADALLRVQCPQLSRQ